MGEDASKRSTIAAMTAIVSVAAIGFALQRFIIDGLADQGHFAKYIFFADEAIRGNLRRDRLADLSPAYFWLVVFIRRFLGWDYTAIRSLQLAVGATTAALAGWTARRIAGTGAGLIATVAVLLSRAALLNATEIEPEVWIAALNVTALASLLDHFERPAIRSRTLLAGIALGLSIAARPTSLAPAAALFVWLAAKTAQRRGVVGVLRSEPPIFALAMILPVAVVAGVNLSLTGQPVVMDPGPAFYEGMNPRATGYAGATPAVVSDIEVTLREPDAIHVAYRIVAAIALQGSVTPNESNEFWTSKAILFARAHPARAAFLVLRKIRGAAHSHDPWDLLTTVRKEKELSRLHIWVPFGLLLTTAFFSFLAAPHQRARLTPLMLYSLAVFAVLSVFYTSSRQRNALVPVIAIVAASLPGELYHGWKPGSRRRATILLALVCVFATLLTVPGSPQREDDYTWTAAIQKMALSDRAAIEARSGEKARSRLTTLEAATWFPRDLAPPAATAPELAAAIDRERASTRSPARVFDLGVTAELAGAWTAAERLFAELEASGYEPIRGNQTTSSVAYHLARARLRTTGEREAGPLVRRSLEEAPGDAYALALAEATGIKPDAGKELESLHDPITAAIARARAQADLGHPERAHAMLKSVQASLPDWTTPAKLAASLR